MGFHAAMVQGDIQFFYRFVFADQALAIEHKQGLDDAERVLEKQFAIDCANVEALDRSDCPAPQH